MLLFCKRGPLLNRLTQLDFFLRIMVVFVLAKTTGWRYFVIILLIKTEEKKKILFTHTFYFEIEKLLNNFYYIALILKFIKLKLFTSFSCFIFIYWLNVLTYVFLF